MAQLIVRDRDDIRQNDEETRRRPQAWDVVAVHDDDVALGVLSPPLAVIAVDGMSVEDASEYLLAGDGRARAKPYPVTEAMRAEIKACRVARVGSRPWYVRAWRAFVALFKRLW